RLSSSGSVAAHVSNSRWRSIAASMLASASTSALGCLPMLQILSLGIRAHALARNGAGNSPPPPRLRANVSAGAAPLADDAPARFMANAKRRRRVRLGTFQHIAEHSLQVRGIGRAVRFTAASNARRVNRARSIGLAGNALQPSPEPRAAQFPPGWQVRQNVKVTALAV